VRRDDHLGRPDDEAKLREHARCGASSGPRAEGVIAAGL
jgi:hypothetical protein